MTKLIGRARSMDMHLTGRTMNAEEALSAGLVARVVPDESVLSTAMEAAQQIASYYRQAVRMAREAVRRTEEVSLAEGLLFERRSFHSLFETPHQVEGMSAFLQRRLLNFRT